MKEMVNIGDTQAFDDAVTMIIEYATDAKLSYKDAKTDFDPDDFSEIISDTSFTDTLFDRVMENMDQNKVKKNVIDQIKSYFNEQDDHGNYVNNYLITDFNITHEEAQEKMRKQIGDNGIYDRNDFDEDQYNNNFNDIADKVVNTYMKQSLESNKGFLMVEALHHDGYVNSDYARKMTQSPMDQVSSEAKHAIMDKKNMKPIKKQKPKM